MALRYRIARDEKLLQKLREVLGKLGLPCEAPPVAKARGPPQRELFDRAPDDDGIDPIGPDHMAQA